MCDQASDLWQQQELVSELESNLSRYCGLGQKVDIDFIDGKTQLVLFDLITLVLISWGWLSLLNWIGVLSLYLLLKLPSRKLGPWFVLWSFFFLRLLFISINMPSCMECCSYVWVGAPSCYLQLLDCYKNRYVGLLVLPVLPVLNP